MEKELGDRAAVDMHFLYLRPSISTSISTGWKAPGISTGRQRADVPDDWALGIEISGADHQQAALLVFARDGVEHLLVGVPAITCDSGVVSAMASL